MLQSEVKVLVMGTFLYIQAEGQSSFSEMISFIGLSEMCCSGFFVHIPCSILAVVLIEMVMYIGR